MMKLPLPDQSWMDTPLKPERFYSWVPREVIEAYSEKGTSQS